MTQGNIFAIYSRACRPVLMRKPKKILAVKSHPVFLDEQGIIRKGLARRFIRHGGLSECKQSIVRLQILAIL